MTKLDDIEQSDKCCPKCGNELVWIYCGHCEDGEIDGYEEDPLWYQPGEFYACPECRGNGIAEWCQQCGWDETFQCFLTGKPSGPIRLDSRALKLISWKARI